MKTDFSRIFHVSGLVMLIVLASLTFFSFDSSLEDSLPVEDILSYKLNVAENSNSDLLTGGSIFDFFRELISAEASEPNTSPSTASAPPSAQDNIGIFAAPTHGIPVLNSSSGTNLTSENLTAYNISTADGDSDPVKNIFNWYLDGSSLTILNMPFEKVTDSVINATKDYSGYDNNGSEHGDVTWNATGGYDGNGAFEFDGDGDYITIPDSDILDYVDSNLSISLWTMNTLPGTDTNAGRLIGKGRTGAAKGYGIYYKASTDKLGWGDLDGLVIKSGLNVNDGAWHHIVATYEEGNTYKLYFDGSELSTSSSGTLDGFNATSEDLCIGCRIYGSALHLYNGSIDEVMLFNRTLTSQQVTALFENKTNTIVSQETVKGQVWNATITPNDGTSDGTTKWSNVLTIENSAPTQGVPVLNSSSGSNSTTEALIVHNVSTSDDNNDTFKNIFNWYRDGTSLAILNMPFEGDGNHNATDYSGYGNDGTAYNATWNSTGGYDGKGAFEFSGNTSYIEINDTSLSSPYITVSAWAKSNITDYITYTGHIVNKMNTNAGTYQLVIDSGTDKAGFIVRLEGSEGTLRFVLADAVVDTGWHHYVGTYDGDKVKLYVDNVLQAMIDDTDGTIDRDNSDILRIGAHPTSPENSFNGTIDDVIIFNRSLSAKQIQALYENRTDLIVSQETRAGEVWNATITPNDGTNNGASNWSNALTIVTNTLPTHATPLLNSTSVNNLTSENLTSYSQSASDADSHAMKEIFDWYVDNSSLTVLNTPFEGGSDSTWTNDYSSNDNDGNVSVNADSWYWQGGHDSKGTYDFDGVDDYIDFGDQDYYDFENTTDFTLSTWIKTNCTSCEIVTKSNGAAPHYRMVIHSTGWVRLVANDGTTVKDISSITRVNDSQWHHVVGVFDRDDKMKLYIDGVKEREKDMSTVGNITNAGSLAIGRFGSSGTSYFDGFIDDVIVFNRSLTSEQILTLYNNDLDIIVPQETIANEQWYANVTINDGYNDSASLLTGILTISSNWTAPIQTENSGTTATDLSTYNSGTISSVSNYIWDEDNTGTVIFQENVNLSTELIGNDDDLDNDIELNNNFFTVDSSSASAFSSKAANVTFENVDCNLCDSNGVLYSSGYYETLNNIQANAESCGITSNCVNFSCTNPGSIGNCSFDVTGFSGYAYGGNANLTINDSAEGSSVQVSTSLTYNAYYINSTSGDHLSGADCNLTDDDGSYIMTDNGVFYNYTKSSGFTTSGTKNWNVTCNLTDYSTLLANDTIAITAAPSIPEFSDYAIALLLLTVISGFFVMRRKGM